jgi:hypothetical protein
MVLSQHHGVLSRCCHVSESSKFGLGVVAHSCNPNYLGGRDWNDHGSRLALVELARPQLNQQTGCGGVCLSS